MERGRYEVLLVFFFHIKIMVLPRILSVKGLTGRCHVLYRKLCILQCMDVRLTVIYIQFRHGLRLSYQKGHEFVFGREKLAHSSGIRNKINAYQ